MYLLVKTLLAILMLLLLVSSCSTSTYKTTYNRPADYSSVSTIKKADLDRPLYQASSSVSTMGDLFAMAEKKIEHSTDTKRESVPFTEKKKSYSTYSKPMRLSPVENKTEQLMTHRHVKDPYLSIPLSESNTSHINKANLLVINQLLGKAKKALAIGKTDLAISQLERALRIERHNPTIWNMMANIYYKKKAYQQAQAMATKSNLYVEQGSLLKRDNESIIDQTK